MPPLLGYGGRMQAMTPKRKPQFQIDPKDFEYETPALDAYKEHVNQAPDYEDFKPGFGSKLMAALSAGLAANQGGVAHGLQVGQSLKDAGWVRAQQQHASRGKQLSDMADVEQKSLDTRHKFNKDLADIVNDQEDNIRADEELDQSKWFQGEQVGNMHADNVREDAADKHKVWFDQESLKDRDRQLDISSGNLDVSRGNLEVSRGQLDVSRRNADTNASRAATYDRFGQASAQARRVPPRDQDEAKQMAIEEVLAEDPEAEKFFEHDEATGRWFEKGTVAGTLFGERELDEEPDERGVSELSHREDIMRRMRQRQNEIANRAFQP